MIFVDFLQLECVESNRTIKSKNVILTPNQILTKELRQDIKRWEELIRENVFRLGGHRDHLPASLAHMLYCIVVKEQYNLAYFFVKRIECAQDYDEEQEMEPRHETTRAAIPPLRVTSSRIHRRGKRTVGFEGAQSKGESRVERNTEGGRPLEEAPRGIRGQDVNLPSLLAAYLGRGENGKPLQSSLTSVYGEDYPLPDGLKIPSHIGSYDRKGDPDNFLHLFERAIRMQKWLMPIACKCSQYPQRLRQNMVE
nr:reverse transcriptase domain-containing protein [Tanacetum cinerariifolium]